MKYILPISIILNWFIALRLLLASHGVKLFGGPIPNSDHLVLFGTAGAAFAAWASQKLIALAWAKLGGMIGGKILPSPGVSDGGLSAWNPLRFPLFGNRQLLIFYGPVDVPQPQPGSPAAPAPNNQPIKIL